MKPSEIESTIFAAEQSLATVREAKLTAQAAYDAQVLAESNALNVPSAARALVANEPEIATEPPDAEPVPLPKWHVSVEGCTASFALPNGPVITPDENRLLAEGHYVVSVSYEDGAGPQSGSTEFFLNANTTIRWSGGPQIVRDI